MRARLKAAKELFVVGVGASAGGFDALDAFFSSAPLDSVAYVIVQHLSSEHKSLLRELLSQHSVLEIVEAQQDVSLAPNKVYVIPSDKELTIRNNHLQLTPKANEARSRTIDTFFKSLAADKKRRAVAIVLSGTGSDGSEGVMAIKKAGGMVLVQEPESAKFDGMPRSAINTGCADFVMPPELMHREVFNYVKVAPIADEVSEMLNSDTESSFFLILDLVHERSGIDFSNYKRPTIIRRISRRMALTDTGDLAGYLDYLNQHPEEAETLGKEFLIGVTQFFRDEEAYDILASNVVPRLVDDKKVSSQLRIWVAGCSSGEEAYSLAILVREYMDNVKKELEVKIFASDIDRDALDYAGKGLYPAGSLAQVSEDRLHTYFVKEEGRYRVSQRIRRMVIFAPHNVANDPPFSRIDLVSCRNMLIYLNPTLQKKVLEKFHYALLTGGYLFLGSSESLGEMKGFVEVNKKWKIYRNAEPAHLLGMEPFASAGLSRKSPIASVPSFTRDLSSKQALHQGFNELLNEVILDEYDYAAVYIDENYDVLHGAGKFKNYLDLPEQNFTFNLLKLVQKDLAIHLSPMLRRAIRDKEKVAVQAMPVRDGDSLRYVNVVVKPYLIEKKLFQPFVLVLFSDEQPRIPLEAALPVRLSDSLQDERVQELETELQQTKEDLQAVVEELETANEELQSTNEELLSSNEELQSTNEELQSLNEELHTINAEHQYKIKALIELDDDLNNYFRSTNIGQIFVDQMLSIRKYTPAATQLINLIESDIGRSIYQISNNLRYDKLVEDIQSVISTTNTIQKEVQDKNGVWYQMRIMPYITQDRRIDGAIVIFILINELKNLHLLHTGILDSSPNAIVALKAVRNEARTIVDFKISNVNHKAQEFFSKPDSSLLLGKSLWKSYPDLLQQGLFERLVQVVDTGQMLDVEQHQLHNHRPLWLHIVAVKFDDGLVLTLHDITERKQHEQALKQQQEEIKASAERFRTLLEAMPHISWTNNPDGAKASFNEYWYEYTGLTAAQSSGWGWAKALHPDDRDIYLANYQKALQEGTIYSAQARVLRRADKQYRWHLIKDVPIQNQQGEIIMWVGTATDNQDQKDAEEATIALRLAQQREIMKAILQTQETERDRISEALHNGLAQILYAAKLKLNSMATVNSDASDTKDHVDQLLSEGITATRNISFELTPSVLKDFGLKTAVEEVVSRITHPGLRITTDIDGCDIRLDYNMELSLYRIIQELLNNILKHSQATEATIELTCEESMVQLCVKDNGIGIDQEELKKPKGIGLHSIQNRVGLLEGKLEVVSSRNKGTIFKIAIQH